MRTRDLAREMRLASAAMTSADIRELEEQYGVPDTAIRIFELVGLARVSRVVDGDVYQPDPTGAWTFLTPVLIHRPETPESPRPEIFVRLGNLIDLVAWDPQAPRSCALRAGQASWLGLVPPQFLDPDPVQVWRSVLNWLRADCTGIVPFGQDPATTYSLLMGFPGGIQAEDEVHLATLRRILERPWPVPSLSVGPPLAREALHAAG